MIHLLPLLILTLIAHTAAQDSPTLHLPSSSVESSISSTFDIDFTLPEDALAGSLIFEMDPFPQDGKGQRTITFGSAALSAGRHTITITPFDQDQADATLVSSVSCDVADCSPAHGNAFLYILAYTGTDAGDDQITSQTDVLYIDLQTDPIALVLPSADDVFVATGFKVQFSKPEEALSGSLQLILSRTGGTVDNAGDRTITLVSSMESQTGTSAEVSITRLEFLASASSLVASVVPSTDLVTGTIYTLTVSYRDRANNVSRGKGGWCGEVQQEGLTFFFFFFFS
jgi:hypothetical protein